MNESDGTIVQSLASQGNTRGSDSDIEARLRAVEAGLMRLEAEMKHIVTKADLEAVTADLIRHFNRAIGIMIAAAGALSATIFGLLRMFGS